MYIEKIYLRSKIHYLYVFNITYSCDSLLIIGHILCE